MDRSWLSVEGYIQPLNNQIELSKIREAGNKQWFVLEGESTLLCYNQNNKNEIPSSQPEGSITISSGRLEVFVILTSDDDKEFILYPGKDESNSDWLVNLKNKTNLDDRTSQSFQRGNQGGFMSRVRNSLRRKKKLTRTYSEDTSSNSSVSERFQMERPSYSPLPTDEAFDELPSLQETFPDGRFPRKSKRSQSCPNNIILDVTGTITKIKGYEDKSCDTSSLENHELEISKDHFSLDQNNKVPQAIKIDQETQTMTTSPSEQALKDALVLLARQIPATDQEDNEEDIDHIDQPRVDYANGVMTLQQQKLIRELEVEVCKLKCEVVHLIQGNIDIPLKDDDLADWHYVEEIKNKDRIFELLREARLYNPSLPNYDSSTCGNFKDGYGFIHGSRESESVVFHYVCRELTQHYSSFYQNRTGHVKLWNEYCQAKQDNDDTMLFQEREIKNLAQEGIPFACRSLVWKCFINEKSKSRPVEKPGFYAKLVKKTCTKKNKLKSEMTEVERQIRCDLLRTMPSNEDFRTLESIGVRKLSRVLHAFVDYKPEIGYLQGMNFLVGLFLLFMEDEEDAFWSLCAIVEVYLKHYFDRVLSGVQADQEVLKELIAETMPALSAHLKHYGVDISTVTFNWFITVYLDAVPFETAVRIWDCFLLNGREVLFRIAIGLLKLQQRSLLQLSGYLEIMQYMKRAARVTYDVDRLFKASFDEITKFPSNEELDEMQKKYRMDIEAKHDFKLTVKHEIKRTRVSSFTVDIATPDRSDRLDHIQVVECAVAASTDLSRPVCIACSVRAETKLYLLDIDKKERSTLMANIDSRVLCADVVGDGTLLIGTMSWFIYAFNLDFCEELWSIQLSDSVVDLCHFQHATNDRVFAALADGSIAVLPNANSQGPPSQGSHVRIGSSSPVMCVTLVDDNVWCACSNNIVVLDMSTLEEVHAMEVTKHPRHQVSRLILGEHGVWCTIRGSPLVILIDKISYDVLLQVDVASDTNILDAINIEKQVKVSPFQECRVTTVLPFSNELWVGLANGQVLIFDIMDCKEDEKDDSSDTIKQPSDESYDGAIESILNPKELDVKDERDEIAKQISMKMRVQYRVSEEAIRSLIVLREVDGPIVFSCAGSLSSEGGISLWEKEITDEDQEEWLPFPVHHRIRHDSRSIPVTSPATSSTPH